MTADTAALRRALAEEITAANPTLAPAWRDAVAEAQLAAPSAELQRQAYGYRPETVADHQQMSLTPELGDALLFNPANFHAVEPCPHGRRIAFAYFLGLTTTGQLIAWTGTLRPLSRPGGASWASINSTLSDRASKRRASSSPQNH